MSGDSSRAPAINPPWRTWQATLAAPLLFVGAQLLMGLVLAAAGVNLGAFTTAQTIGLGLVAAAATTASAVWFASWFGGDPTRHLGLIKPPKSIWPRIALGLLAFIVFSSLLSVVAESVWPNFEADQEQNLGLGEFGGSVEYLGAFVLLVIAAPITEELVFRGILFAGWRRHGFVMAAAFSSLLFGLAHWQPNVALATFVLGWLLAWLYERSGSLWAPIGLHALKNGLAFALVYVVEIS